MSKVTVAAAKARFSEYLDRAAGGERIVICRHSKPVAELRAVEEVRSAPRPIGPLAGRPTFALPASFFEPLAEDELAQWDRDAGIVVDTGGERRSGRASRVAEPKPAYGRPKTRRRARPRS